MLGDPLSCATPIVFFVFNRPEHTLRVFRRIAQAGPSQLLIVADGPRPDRPEEAKACDEVRAIVSQVDWPCNVQTNFSATNMGCRRRLVSGLDWAFEQVEQAIILEDDILPDPSFFPFCEEMLARYADDRRFSIIGGFNIVQSRIKLSHRMTEDSYYFSQLTHVWGWATWRWSWKRYDESLTHWPAIREAGLLRSFFMKPFQYRFWSFVFDRMHAGTGPNTWDYQWVYSNFINNALSIIPAVNLVENIGFGPGATHTLEESYKPAVQVDSITFPLRHPHAIVPRRDLDKLDDRVSGHIIPSLFTRGMRKLQKMLRRGSAG